MKEVEELKSMTTEDLVRKVQELQEKNNTLKSDKDFWYNECEKYKERYNSLVNTIEAVAKLAKNG